MGNGSDRDGADEERRGTHDRLWIPSAGARLVVRVALRLAPLNAPHIPAGDAGPDGGDMDVILIF